MLRKRLTKQLIIESAAELLRVSDMEHVTVRSIVENCGISPQTFYNHFKDKYEVVAQLYTDAMAPYVMADLEDWFKKKLEFVMGDMPLFNRAFDYSGQNSLSSTLISFDSQKYLLHLSPEVDLSSVEGRIIRQGIDLFIYGQFGLYDLVRKDRFPLTDKEFSDNFPTITDIMLAWAPKVLDGKLLPQAQCKHAWWDAESERIIVEK